MSTGKVRFSDKRSLNLFSLIGMVLIAISMLAAPAEAKKTFFQTPAYDKLLDGAGPQTNDATTKTTGQTNTSLAPITIDQDSTASTDSTADNGDGHYLKSTVSTSEYAPKGPVDTGSVSLFAGKQSMSSKLSEKGILKTAQGVGLMPIPLMESQDEQQKKVDTILDSEKKELSDLWESTLTRSPDIQFVVQKLMPTSNPGHAATIASRMLSTAIFAGLGAAQMIAPSPGAYMGGGAAQSAMGQLLGMQNSKNAKKAQLSETESIMLYTIVRQTADKLVEDYRNYKKYVGTMSKAGMDLQDLQNMVNDSRTAQDAPRQLEMEYELRKAQREIDVLAEDVRRYRQRLVDTAGVESVVKLDKQLEDEAAKIELASPTGSANTQTAAAKASPSSL